MEALRQLKTQLLLGMGTVFFVVFMASMTLLSHIDETKSLASQQLQLRNPTALTSKSMELALHESISALRGWINTHDPELRSQYEAAWRSIANHEATMAELAPGWTNPENSRRLQEITPLLLRLKQLQDRAISLPIAQREQAHDFVASDIDPLASKVLKTLESMVIDQQRLSLIDLKASVASVDSVNRLTKLFLAVLFTLLVILAIYAFRGIFAPVNSAIRAANRISSLDLETPVALSGATEFQHLGESLEHMRASLNRSQTELVTLNSELMQFSYRTSHDLKGPLTSSKRLAEFISKDIESGRYKEASENAQKVAAQMQRLETLVGDLLELVKADQNEEEQLKIDFENLVDEVKQNLDWLTEQNPCEIRCDVNIESEFYAERARLLQIVENLASNGIKYRDPDSEYSFVELRVDEDASSVRLQVLDNGVGIPEDNRAELFQMFKRFHPDLNSGSGLGMSIVKKHIDHMGGTIALADTASGSQFDIHLPKSA